MLVFLYFIFQIFGLLFERRNFSSKLIDLSNKTKFFGLKFRILGKEFSNLPFSERELIFEEYDMLRLNI